MRNKDYFSALPTGITKCLTSQDGDFVMYHVLVGYKQEFRCMMLLFNLRFDNKYFRTRDTDTIVGGADWCNVRELYNYIHKTNFKPEVEDGCKPKSYEFDQVRIATGLHKDLLKP